MTSRLRVGVIGLGRRWERYRPALTAARGSFAVTTVYDTSTRRTQRVARELGCQAAAGTVDLIDRAEVEAVLLFGRAWYGLWPVEAAVRAGKPVFCDASLAADHEHADGLAALVGRSNAVVVTAATRSAALERLLRERDLGSVRRVSAEAVVATGGDPLRSRTLLDLVQMCGGLLGGAPREVWAVAPEGCGTASVTFAWGDGRVAQVSVGVGVSRWPTRVTVTAERGSVTAASPRLLCWRDGSGEHTLRVAHGHGPYEALKAFRKQVRGRTSAVSGFVETYRALTWLRAAWRSQAAGGGGVAVEA